MRWGVEASWSNPDTIEYGIIKYYGFLPDTIR
jgi:hypothetical protein